jgi:alkylation response protein AidB-like acyl-CoA dehydrogenase
MAELGWLAAPLPEALGGLGGSFIEAGLVMREAGRTLFPSPYLTTVVLSAAAILGAGTPEQQRSLIGAIAAGRLRVALGYLEPAGRYDPTFCETRARRSGSGYVLDGLKCVVRDAPAADLILVTARMVELAGAPLGLFAVSRTGKGVTLSAYATQDGGRAADVMLEQAPVDADGLLGEPGAALPAIERAIDCAAAAGLADTLGAMWAVHDLTLGYIKTRKQFGQTIGSFQAVQHRMVDLYMACQLAEGMVWDALAATGSSDPAERARRVSAAKVHVDRAARKVGGEGVQLHGGIGMTMDVPVGHLFKRISVNATSYGDAAWHLARYRRLLA